MSREIKTNLSQHAEYRRDKLSVLLSTAKRVKRTLKPVAAKRAFRTRLRDGLLMAAHHQQAHRLTMKPRNDSRLGWVIGAAALGSAGLIAIMLRARQAQRASESRVPPESAN